MKTFLLTLLFTLTAQAAKFEPISTFEDRGLKAIKETFEDASEFFDADHHSIGTNGVKIISRSRSELPEKTIKQMLYILRTSWGQLETAQVSKLTLEQMDEEMMLPLEQLLERDYVDAVPFIRTYQKTYAKVLKARHYRFFKTEDATPYGGCNSTVIESLKTMEVLALDACWFE